MEFEDIYKHTKPEQVNEETFTRRHFVQIANILKNAKTVDEVTEEMIRMFMADNPRFDRDRFMKAVGKTEEPKPEQKDEKKE